MITIRENQLSHRMWWKGAGGWRLRQAGKGKPPVTECGTLLRTTQVLKNRWTSLIGECGGQGKQQEAKSVVQTEDECCYRVKVTHQFLLSKPECFGPCHYEVCFYNESQQQMKIDIPYELIFHVILNRLGTWPIWFYSFTWQKNSEKIKEGQ